jgi:hypothetical protein
MTKQLFILILTLGIAFLTLDCASKNKTKERAEYRVEECLRYIRGGDTFNLRKMLTPEQRQDQAGANFLEIVEKFSPYLKEPSSDSKVYTENFVFGENEASFTLIWLISIQGTGSIMKIKMDMRLEFQKGDWYIEAGNAEVV